MNHDTPARHLSSAGLEQFLQAGVPALIRLDGSPVTLLAIDPPEGQMALRVRSDGEIAQGLESFRLISPSIVWFEGERYIELRIAGGGALVEAYPILCALADRVQIHGDEFNVAAQDVLAKFRRLLQGLGRMTDDEEVGLFGELMVFRRFLADLGPGPTLEAWTGPENEERDFSILECDIEVKTTTSEQRVHWVHGLAQLLPTAERPLWLISIQLTGGGEAGDTLEDLVNRVRAALGDQVSVDRFDEAIRKRHWDDDQAGLFSRRYILRTPPCAFEVAEGFPSITPDLFEATGRSHSRISQVSYRIDLTSMEVRPLPPFPLDTFESKE